MTRYSPSRHYLAAGMVAVLLAALSGWFAVEWILSLVACVLFLLSAAVVLWLALRPAVEVNEKCLKVGRRVIPWNDIRRVDRTGWISPLVVHLVFSGGGRMLLFYPGDLESANNLLRQLRRYSREALIDGVPYRQFWGDAPVAPQPRNLPSPRYQLLRPDDEAEVERLYQLLKTVGHLDPKNHPDEK